MTPTLPLTHEEYQKALRETLAPTLEYKAKWEELKELILTSNSEDVLIDGPNSNPYFTCDQRWGFDSALHWIDMKMKELEEK